MNINCQCTLGPYQGYFGVARYDQAVKLFHAEVGGIKDVVTFQAKTVADLEAAFADSVDDYLDFCKQRGERPENSSSV